MKALIITAKGAEDTELLYPYYRLREENIEVDVAAPEKGEVEGEYGYSVEAGLKLDDVKADDYDLLVIPGGKGPESVRLNKNAVSVAKQMVESDKVVASVCHGIQVLVSAGVLQGRTVTCWQGVQDDAKAAGATYKDQEVVVDKKLITSRCPDDLPAFCREIFKQIG